MLNIVPNIERFVEIGKPGNTEYNGGIENLPRYVAIYLARCVSRKTLAEIGKAFGISNYSTVSSAIERVKERQECDGQVRKDIVKLKLSVKKSQQQT